MGLGFSQALFPLLPHRSQQPAEPFSLTGARGISDGFLFHRTLVIPIHLCCYAMTYVYIYI